MIAADPHQGGATWAVLQYLIGFRRLGHTVYFIEPIQQSAVRPEGIPFGHSTNAAYFRDVVNEFGLEGTSALLLTGSQQTVGLSYAELCQAAKHADVLFNISGMLADPELLGPIPRRVYLDLDPAFIQLWQAVQGIDMRFKGHTHFVTVGQAIGTPDCDVPTCGHAWIPTFQPVVLEHWPVADQIVYEGLTTVGNWRGYGSIEYGDVHYGQKAHSWRRFMDLPQRTRDQFMPALAIHHGETKDLEALTTNRWHLLDPAKVAGTPAAYRKFIQSSWAEFGIAKSGYVVSSCGWFSDRSACYLASGRPVLAQETGFSRFLPTSQGLFAFQTSDDVLAALEALRADYKRHSRSARDLAETYFDSDKVLPMLLKRIGVPS
jgi:hypothetical protein